MDYQGDEGDPISVLEQHAEIRSRLKHIGQLGGKWV